MKTGSDTWTYSTFLFEFSLFFFKLDLIKGATNFNLESGL